MISIIKNLLSVTAAAYIIYADSLAEDENLQYKVYGGSPKSQLRTDDVLCGETKFRIVSNMINPPRSRILEVVESGNHLPDNVTTAIRELYSSFVRIDMTNFSCGHSGFSVTGKAEAPRLPDVVEIEITGRNNNERVEAADECWLMSGFYDDSAKGSVIVSKDRVIKVTEPGIGVCITKFGPGVEIRSENMADGASL